MALERLVHDVKALRTAWENEPLHTRGLDDFDDVFSPDLAERLIVDHGLRIPYLRLLRDGAYVPAGRFTHRTGTGAGQADGVADPHTVAEHIAARYAELPGPAPRGRLAGAPPPHPGHPPAPEADRRDRAVERPGRPPSAAAPAPAAPTAAGRAQGIGHRPERQRLAQRMTPSIPASPSTITTAGRVPSRPATCASSASLPHEREPRAAAGPRRPTAIRGTSCAERQHHPRHRTLFSP
ncbi:hypothetical protein ACWEQL_11555 [Kitasatospora sp. NPDC004240]